MVPLAICFGLLLVTHGAIHDLWKLAGVMFNCTISCEKPEVCNFAIRPSM